MNKRITTLIVFGLTLQLLLGIGSTIILSYYYKQQLDSLDKRQQLTLDAEYKISQMRFEYNAMAHVLSSSLLQPNLSETEFKNSYKMIFEHLLATQNYLKQTQAMLESKVSQEKANKIARSLERNFNTLQLGLSDSIYLKPDSGKYYYIDQFVPIYEETRNQIIELSNLAHIKTNQIKQQSSELASSLQRIAVIIILLMWLVGMLSANAMRKYINKLMGSFITSARQSKQMLAYSIDIRCFIDAQGLFTRLNRTCESIWGYSQNQLIGYRFIDLIHPEDQAHTKEIWSQLSSDQSVKAFNARLMHLDGSVMHMSWSVMWSSASKSYFCVGRDETKTVLAEKALRQNESYTSLVIATAHDAFVCIDENSVITDWNPQAETVFGWTKQEVLGQQLDTLIIPEAMRERHRVGLKHFLATGIGPVINKRIELKAIHKLGHELLIEITISPILIDGNYRFSAFMRDVTAVRQAQLELEESKELAETATRAKSEFLANMSHEIRTPMNGVISSTMLLLKTPLVGEQKQYLTMIKTSADSLLHIIDEILDLSKLEANKLELDIARFEFRDTIEGTFKTFSSNAHDKNLELICQISPSVPTHLVGDDARINQIITNLTHNAIKFTHEGEVVLKVSEVARSNQAITLDFCVSDTGIGISEEQQQHICKAFVQADQSTTRIYGGTGLGLAIVTNLVDKMNGKFWIESEVGHGSSFHVELTLDITEIESNETSKISLANVAELPIFILSQNALIISALKDNLIHLGANPQSARSISDLHQLMHEHAQEKTPTRLVLIDLSGPKNEIYDFLAQHLSQPLLRDAFVVLLTATNLEFSEFKRFNALGLNSRLHKPIKQSELHQIISELLNNKKPEIQLINNSKHIADTANKNKLRVLVAEDHPINQEVIRAILQHQGYQYRIVENGLEVIQMLEHETFDVILMDMQMPVMDGCQATEEIRLREKLTGQHIRIIAITANAMIGDREICMAAGMDDYITKPLNPEQLMALLDSENQQYPESIESKNHEVKSSNTETIVFNQTSLEYRVLGQKIPSMKMAELFLKELPITMTALDKALATNNINQIARSAHKMAGAAAMLGAEQLASIAEELETDARVGALNTLGNLIEKLKLAADLLSKELQDFISNKYKT